MYNQGTHVTSRLDYTNFVVNPAHTDGAIEKVGTSSAPLTSSTASMPFKKLYTKSTATSGDNRGLYHKHILGGTIASTGYGDGHRVWTSVTGTGYSYASGVHATMSVEAAATVTGSGSGLRATLGAAAATRTLDGSLAAVHACSDIATGNTVPTQHAFFKVTDDGAVRFSNLFITPNAANGTLLAAHVTDAMTHSLKCITAGGTAFYIQCTTTATNRS